MTEAFKNALELLAPFFTSAQMLAVFLLLALIYIWYQHHRAKLLQQVIALKEERRKQAAEQLLSQKPLAAGQGAETTGSSSHGCACPQQTILVAEDETAVRQFLERYLPRLIEGVRVKAVADGQEAIESLSKEVPSILILDMAMPRKSGYDVLDEIAKRNLSFPIVVSSGYVDESNFSPAAAVSGDKVLFVPKPYSVPEIVQALQQLLRGKNVQQVKSSAGGKPRR